MPHLDVYAETGRGSDNGRQTVGCTISMSRNLTTFEAVDQIRELHLNFHGSLKVLNLKQNLILLKTAQNFLCGLHFQPHTNVLNRL